MVFLDTIDIYYVLVEVIFGSIFWSGLAILAVLFLVGILTRMSFLSIIFITGLFAITFFSGYYDSLVMLIAFILSALWMISGIMNFINARRYA